VLVRRQADAVEIAVGMAGADSCGDISSRSINLKRRRYPRQLRSTVLKHDGATASSRLWENTKASRGWLTDSKAEFDKSGLGPARPKGVESMRYQYRDTYDDQNACYVCPHERFFRAGSDNRAREMHSQSQLQQSAGIGML
jgi:hypothetical protein